MTSANSPATLPDPLAAIEARRERVAAIRSGIATRLAAGDKGLLIGTTIGRQFSQFIADLAIAELPQELAKHAAVVGVGGTGRGVMAPHSDIDLMLLVEPSHLAAFEDAVPPFVQAIWDANLRLGHSVRTVRQAIGLAMEDDKTATSYLSTVCLWGQERLHHQLSEQFYRRVVDRSRAKFTERCVRARESEFTEQHPAVQLLEPNVKTSLGGLRDVQLAMWIAEAHYRVSDFFTLQLMANVLSQPDAVRMAEAYDFLLNIRTRLHLWSDRGQDHLTRAAQLAIAERMGLERNETQRGVERLMQQYFRQTGGVDAIVHRFVNRHRPRPLLKKIKEVVRERRVDGNLIVGPIRVDAKESAHERLTESVESILRIYEVASNRGVLPSPTLSEAIRIAATQHLIDRPRHDGVCDEDLALSKTTQQRFLTILQNSESLAKTLRHMAETGALDLVLPEWGHLRGLLQFNQYHHFTVDEHTVRAVDFLTKLASEQSDAGTAYRNLKNKPVVHLALILHDIGKGYETDHCLVGADIARVVGPRLGLSDNGCKQVESLVRWHLEMPDLALRRDVTDEKLLVAFAQKVGTSDTLTMLYTLVVADIRGVGPGTWTKWKGELLADLYRRTSVIVAGKPYRGFEDNQIAETIRRVVALPVPASGFNSPEAWSEYVRRQLSGFSAYYLTTTPPEMIAEDLARIRELGPGEVDVITSIDETTGAFDLRVLLKEETAPSCFHQLCGVLAARSLRIVAAEINTTDDGYVVDGFRTTPLFDDRTNALQTMRSIETDIRRVLLENEEVTEIFQKNERYGVESEDADLPSGLTSRVEIDAESSNSRLVIDVFTHSRRGLLYTLAKTIRDLNLDVDLAKIGTHFDQVVDVFYVTERDGSKPTDADRLTEIRETLTQKLEDFHHGGFRNFRRSSTSLFG